MTTCTARAVSRKTKCRTIREPTPTRTIWTAGATAATTAACTQAAPKAAAPAGAQGSVVVTAPMPGKILAVKANAGQAVKKGDVIMVLEAMKMENDIVAPQDGTVASIDVAEGASVENGDTLATMN